MFRISHLESDFHTIHMTFVVSNQISYEKAIIDVISNKPSVGKIYLNSTTLQTTETGDTIAKQKLHISEMR